MIGFLARLRGSISFRLTLAYGLLATLTTITLIVFISVQFIGTLRAEYSQQIIATAQRLILEYEAGGRDALIASIEARLAEQIYPDREILLLVDPQGMKAAGNVEVPPRFRTSYSSARNAEIIHGSISTRGHLEVTVLTNDETLVVGHSASEIGSIVALIGTSIATALVLATLLVLVGTYIFRRELTHRVSHIRGTTQQIGAGQLSKRVPARGDDDEFTLLHRDINTMLDRIELLMKSARHISDTIAHNLRTPLTRIIGALRVAQRPGASMADVLEANQRAIDDIEGLNVLLNKLLQIAELEAGIQRRSFKPCELNVIVADVIDMYESLAEEKGVSLHQTNLDKVTLQGDANLLASALANLIDNAVKYATRQVTINVAEHAGIARVVIEDDGPGLAAADHEHLGKHFYRSDPSSEGHGLGLTSVMGIVGLHCGTLAFSDAQPGLRVTVSLPVDAKPMESKP